MDPIVAAGLAGTIVTFIDFSIKLYCRTAEFYTSPKGACANAIDAETTTNHLLLSMELLRTHAALATSYGVDADLMALCESCTSVAEDLLKILEPLTKKGRNSKWSSLKKAILSVTTQQHVKDLMTRLRTLQEQVQL